MCVKYCLGGVRDQSTIEIIDTTLVNKGIGNIFQDAYNRRQMYKFVSARRLYVCISMMQTVITQDR